MTWYLALLVLVTLSFLLSGLESAVMSVSRVRVRHAATQGDRHATRLLSLVEDRNLLLACITVANHVVNLGAFLIISLEILGLSSPWGYFLAFVVALPIFLIGLEVVPKKLFRRYPYRSLRTLMPLVQAVGIFRPMFRAFVRAQSNASTPLSGISETREDLVKQARLLSSQSQISKGAASLVQCVLDYRRLTAKEVMQPLTRSVALAGDLPLSTALILGREHGCDALPVLGEKGEFVGLLEISTIPPSLPADRMVRQHMRTLDHIPVNEPAWRILQKLRKRGRSTMLVEDMDHTPLGLVTEDELIRRLMRLEFVPESV